MGAQSVLLAFVAVLGPAVRGPAQGGLGYPSGHAAVSVALGILATSSTRARAIALSAAALTGLSRIYVGAHMPLDVLGGFAAGWLAGCSGSAARPD